MPLSFASLSGDLLENYCYDDMNIARVLFCISILLTYPLECFVAREVIKLSTFNYQRKIKHAFTLCADNTNSNQKIFFEWTRGIWPECESKRSEGWRRSECENYFLNNNFNFCFPEQLVNYPLYRLCRVFCLAHEWMSGSNFRAECKLWDFHVCLRQI